MLIGLDIRSVYSPDSRYRGIGEYGRNLLRHLLSRERFGSYLLFSGKDFLSAAADLPPGTKIFYLKRARRLSWVQDQIFLPLEILFKKIDLFHALSPNLPVFKTAKTVVSVHDLIPLIRPQQYLLTGSVRLWYGMQLKFLNQADRIIVNTRHTEQDLVRRVGVAREKIRVVYYGVNPAYRAAVDMTNWPRLREKFKIGKKYILYVGGFDQRKNIPFLIRAFKTIRENMDISLVLVGAYADKDSSLFELVREYGLTRDVIFTGFIALEQLRMLYRNAEAFAFPSLYEGFGLPLIEAMASGTAIVALDSSATPEITQDAALLVRPDDKEAFAQALMKVVHDEGLRVRLREKGLKRAQDFSWDRAAEQTVAVYHEVLNG